MRECKGFCSDKWDGFLRHVTSKRKAPGPNMVPYTVFRLNVIRSSHFLFARSKTQLVAYAPKCIFQVLTAFVIHLGLYTLRQVAYLTARIQITV